MFDLRHKLAERIHCEHWWFREFFAEFLGTAFLVALGDGAVAQVVLSKQANGTFLTINLAFFLAITFGVYISGGVSGGHINPAITLVMCLLGKTKWRKLPVYWAAQYLGAFAGSACLFCIYYDAISNLDGGIRQVFGPNATAGIFATYPVEYVSIGTTFFDQMFGTATLALCVMALTDARNMEVPKHMIPLLVGLVVGLIGMSYGMNCGYAINPARDLGPRLFTAMAGYGLEVFSYRSFNWFWVPLVAPHIGAICGALLYESLIGLHWPEVSDLDLASTRHKRQNNETDFNLTQFSKTPVNNFGTGATNGGYTNTAMHVYVS